MRSCPSCGEARPEGMYYSSAKTSVRECRLCWRARLERRRAPRLQYTNQLKIERGCADCGIRSPEHPEIFDFDHIPGSSKIASVAAFLTKGTMDDLIAEVAKCEVVCANCHRIRTQQRDHPAFGKDRM